MYDRQNYGSKETLDLLFKKGPMRIIAIAVVALVLLIFTQPWVQVGPGQRGVVLNFGAVQNEVLDEGLHFRVPLMQRVVLVDVKIQKIETDAAAASADLQDVSSRVALNFHIMPDRANIVFQTIGIHFRERVIDPAILETVKAVTARYSAEELITRRQAVSDSMRKELMERLTPHNIAIDAFSIVSFSFSKVFTEAIEQKQTAEQLALKAKRDLDRVRIEAEQRLTSARAEAEALRLQRANLSPDLIELRRVEASIRAIEKWNGILPQVTGGGTIPFIGIGDPTKK